MGPPSVGCGSEHPSRVFWRRIQLNQQAALFNGFGDREEYTMRLIRLALGRVFLILSSPAAVWAQPADLVIANAKVITIDSGSRVAEAVAIRSDRIIAVGTN